MQQGRALVARHRRLTRTLIASLLLSRLLVYHPRRPLHQRIHQVPNLACEDLHLGIAAPNQQTVALDFDGQIISPSDYPLDKAQSVQSTVFSIVRQ